MGMAGLIAELPRDFVLTLVDVGSAGGVHPRWRPFRPILSSILFDPREESARGSFGPGETRVYPVALSDRSGQAELHFTRLANMSSFLRPDAETLGRYRKKGRDIELVGSEVVPVERLDTLASSDVFQPDVLKVDTQGSELMVLKGAEESLQSVVLAEVEVSFFRRYFGQPLFAEIESWMNERGFELIDLLRMKRYRAANSLGVRRPLLEGDERSGRVAYGDAIFLRSEQSLLALAGTDSGASLLRAVIALLAYGKTDVAAALLDGGRHLIDKNRSAAIGTALQALDRKRTTPLFRRLFGTSRD